MRLGQNITINGVRIFQPDQCTVSYYNISNAGRVANGLMVMDIIAQKAKLSNTWSSINSVDRQQIFALVYNPSQPFFTVQYDEDGMTYTKTMYAGELDTDRFRIPDSKMAGSLWWWKNFKVDFIEQ